MLINVNELPLIPNSKLIGGITEDKLDFNPLIGVPSKNLFDLSTVTLEKYLVLSNGTLAPLAGNTVSDFIPISGSLVYAQSRVESPGNWVCFYDVNKTFISSITSSSMVNNTYTSPSNASFIRINTKTVDIGIQQLEVGSAKTSYESFGTKLPRKDVRNLDNPYDFEILLPEDIYVISGEMFSIFFDNMIKYHQYFDKGSYYIAIQEKTGTSTYAGKGDMYNYKWNYTATDGEADFEMEFRVVSTYNGSVLTSKVVTFHVADSSNAANHGRTANIVTVGDSFIDGYPVIFNTYTNITTKGGINSANFIGLNSGNGSLLVKDDAWSGYTYDWFYDAEAGYLRSDRPLEDARWDSDWGENEIFGWTTGETWADLSALQKTHGFTRNEFYNPSTSIFDFSYYISTFSSRLGTTSIDSFICALGLNDIAWLTLNDAETGLSALQAKILHIIDSVHLYDSNIKFLLYTLPNQPNNNNSIGEGFTTFNNYVRVNHNISLFNSMLINNFSNIANVIVIPSGVNFDSRTGIISENYYPNKFEPTYSESWAGDIHPSAEGSKYLADTFYQTIYNMVLS